MPLDLLDEKGFIFLDRANRPYLCRIWGGVPWLFYWQVEGHWVSLRQVTQAEVWSYPHNLSEEQQDHYRRLHGQWEAQYAALWRAMPPDDVTGGAV
jgi:hypothetical protein